MWSSSSANQMWKWPGSAFFAVLVMESETSVMDLDFLFSFFLFKDIYKNSNSFIKRRRPETKIASQQYETYLQDSGLDHDINFHYV